MQSLTGMFNKFIWFLGVVEDRNDPLMLGRVRVRCFGYHTEDKNLIPTDDLPWASTIIPTNDMGKNIKAPKDGSVVVGFFMDGESAQYPVVMGIIPGIPENIANSAKGFSDQRSANGSIQSAPNKIASKTFNTDGSGVDIIEDESKEYPSSSDINEPDTSRLARNENIQDTIIQEKRDNLDLNVDIAGSFKSPSLGKFSEPETKYSTLYPYNNVIETESGHIIELDDSKGFERIHIYHRTGTFIEIHPDGSSVIKNTGNSYEITMKEKNIHVMGRCNITVDGNSNIYTKGNSNIEVDGNLNYRVKGNLNYYVMGSKNVLVNGNISEKAIENIVIEGSTVNLNP